MKIPFMKAQGAGNDFIIVDKNVDFIRKSKKVIKRLCDRRFGVGCDQLILLKKISSYYQVTFYNSDGSLGKNCGNGLRCAYKYLVEVKKVKKAVIKTHKFLHFGKKTQKEYKINVGEVTLDWKKIPLSKKMDSQSIQIKKIKIPGLIKIMGANIGNPHCVVLVKNLKLIKLNMLGPLLVKNKLFPENTEPMIWTHVWVTYYDYIFHHLGYKFCKKILDDLKEMGPSLNLLHFQLLNVLQDV